MSPIIIEPFSYKTSENFTYYVHSSKAVELAVHHSQKIIYLSSRMIWDSTTFFSGDELRTIAIKYRMVGYQWYDNIAWHQCYTYQRLNATSQDLIMAVVD